MSVFSSLTNRIFLGSALLVVVAMAVATYRVSTTVTAQAEQDLRTRLAEASTLVAEFARTQFQDFVVKGSLIADLPVLRNAASTDHPPTVQPIAEDYQRRIGADIVVVLGRNGAILASAGRVKPDADSVGALVRACLAAADGTTFWPSRGGVVHAAALAMEPGVSPAGTLIVGFSLDQQAAERLKALTHSDVAFLFEGRVVAGTRGGLPVETLSAVTAGHSEFVWAEDGEDLIGRVASVGEDPVRGPLAVVIRSRSEHLQVLRRLRGQFIVTGLAAVGVATLVGYAVARSVTRPLRAVTATMREIAATGDLTRAVPGAGRWDDEDARVLSASFAQLTGSLRHFQRVATQRERLSSLGRLSTVVAHEVRNPLMIIKSAVRSLRKATGADVAAAADSIDEEVARLDRVVTGALDFAKPIRFDLAPADAVAICRDACAAAQRAAPGIPIVMTAGPESLPITTDAERLRSVLINLLGNAQDAVRATTSEGAKAAPIHVGATELRAAWIRLTVADQGVGVRAEHLSEVFEPFFTTKRTGSGLGLAIAKNIVEGLGGTIVIDSHPRSGTTVTVDVPAVAGAAGSPA